MDGLANVWSDWIRAYRIDGFRVDTAKHVDRAFFSAWMPKIRAAARTAGVPAFEIFGEVFETDAATLASFVRERGVPEVIDFPLQDALMRYAGGSAGARGISTRLGDDDYFRLGDGAAPAPVTFLGNHDVGRAALKIKEQGGAEGAELLARDLLGHSLLYLLRGAPAVFYGDEVGMIGRGGDKAARQDLFPTAVAEWRTEERVGSPAIGTRLVVRPRRASGVRAPAHARSAPRRASRALDRRVLRPARARGDARREPDRPRRAPRVSRRLQRVRDGRDRDRADSDAVVGVGAAPRCCVGHVVARERANDAADPAAVRGALPRRQRAPAPRARRGSG